MAKDTFPAQVFVYKDIDQNSGELMLLAERSLEACVTEVTKEPIVVGVYTLARVVRVRATVETVETEKGRKTRAV